MTLLCLRDISIVYTAIPFISIQSFSTILFVYGEEIGLELPSISNVSAIASNVSVPADQFYICCLVALVKKPLFQTPNATRECEMLNK